MTRYEEAFETDWTSITPEEAARHAYAIGVEEELEAQNNAHLHALLEAMDNAYSRSMVELAYKKGRSNASAIGSSEQSATVWSTLVEQEHTEQPNLVEPPEFLETITLPPTLNRQDIDSAAAARRPEFLDR